eukprot:8178304-Pyramimonas_sp.AAC.1
MPDLVESLARSPRAAGPPAPLARWPGGRPRPGRSAPRGPRLCGQRPSGLLWRGSATDGPPR